MPASTPAAVVSHVSGSTDPSPAAGAGAGGCGASSSSAGRVGLFPGRKRASRAVTPTMKNTASAHSPAHARWMRISNGPHGIAARSRHSPPHKGCNSDGISESPACLTIDAAGAPGTGDHASVAT